jgi:hypothetical protein
VQFGQRFDYWNVVAETAIVCEPIAYDVVHGEAEPERLFLPATSQYEDGVRGLLRELGEPQLRQMREDLAFAAELMDPNRMVHVLLRLMKSRERAKLKGPLGCAMHLLAMAETIRRAAERSFGRTLQEEDEIGPGQWFPGARKMLYGSERVFDAPRRDLRDYLTLLGLDFGVKVRCYIEGYTELGALEHAIGDFGHAQLINLKGSVAERGGKGLAFAESLAADKRAGVFSVVVLDGDRSEYLRIVRRAAREERFFGSFFFSEPDIEYANFSAEELIDIAIQVNQQMNASLEKVDSRRQALMDNAATVRSGADLLSLLGEHGLEGVSKGERWGKALMTHAIGHPVFPNEHPHAGQTRPIVEIAELIIRVRDVGFLRAVSQERLDPETGRVVLRYPNANS